ncbi:MAG: MoaD/ThiS family protein [Tepidiformaceae bacterium]
MTVHVKWFPTLVKRTHSKQGSTEVAWRAGLTAREVFRAEGFSDADGESVLVLINDSQAEGGDLLKDGDRLEFMVSIQGG